MTTEAGAEWNPTGTSRRVRHAGVEAAIQVAAIEASNGSGEEEALARQGSERDRPAIKGRLLGTSRRRIR